MKSLNLPPFQLASSRPRRVMPATLTVVFVILAFGFGWLAGSNNQAPATVGGHVVNINKTVPAYLSKDVDFSLFWNVWDYIHRTSLERPLVDTKLFYGALEGMVASLGDPYSTYMDPSTAKSFADELEGNFDGIGAEIGLRDDKLVVIAPLPNTPAARARLKAGDRILRINKIDTSDMTVDYAVSLIRGPRGTKVILTVVSSGEKEAREVSMMRDNITIQLVAGEMKTLPRSKGQVAYIKIVHFSSKSDELFRATWQNLAVKGPQGIVLDLRNNPGGFLDEAVNVASHWIASGPIVKEQFVPPDFNEYKSTGRGELKGIPTVVLVNQGSASASEIVAGALQDAGVATVIGETTFGKGSVQNVKDFDDGSALKLTVAKWFTPKGRSIDKNGIKPDIEVKLTKDDFSANRDPQINRALEILSK